MRSRRGNYTLLFVFTSGALFFFMAFAIDIARLRVARASVQNAAEAGAIAALMEVRRGRTRGAAELAADRAASFVTLNGIAGGGGTQTVNVDIDWGEWRWERPQADAWSPTPSGRQALTVNARTSTGITTFILPIASTLIGGEVQNGGRFPLGTSARAALRSRDIVIAFDVSRMSSFAVEEMRQALQTGLQAIDDQRIRGDRISLVPYAGDAWIYDLANPAGLVATASNVGGVVDTIAAQEPPLQQALFDARLFSVQADQIAQRVQSCWMGPEVYHRLHRFFRPGLFNDQELPNQQIQYGFIRGDQFLNAVPSVPWDDPNFASARLWLDQTTSIDQAQWDALFGQPLLGPNLGLDVVQQCQVWLMGLAHWLEMDPRVRGNEQLGADGTRSPLSCHAGAELVVQPETANSFNADFAVPEVFGCTGGLTFVDHTTGIQYPAWNFDDPVADNPGMGGVAGTDSRDMRFAWAGSNPGAAMRTAADILATRDDQSREAVVFLLAGSGPTCGPNIEQVSSGFCAAPYLDEFATAQSRLAQLRAHVYIAGDPNAPNGAVVGDFLYAVGATGRGFYQRVEEPGALIGTFLEFISDVQIQVVQ